ncbi:hypothetical protein I7I51_05802 [Histoplasma capsulatum]|uniref:Uncharacterized protein n=1 Tax=Ajellomyces capsulatus TaxID=5037 RepID=A0A8A1M5R0_AJECA|nr:hypothetical protein I7I51_05802 [Histoplasma capsulatum]
MSPSCKSEAPSTGVSACDNPSNLQAKSDEASGHLESVLTILTIFWALVKILTRPRIEFPAFKGMLEQVMGIFTWCPCWKTWERQGSIYGWRYVDTVPTGNPPTTLGGTLVTLKALISALHREVHDINNG